MKDSEKADRNVDAKAIIKAVLTHVGMRAPSFAKAIGINYQRVFDLQNGRTKKFNPGVVNLICARFPEINKMYLYTGEGSLTLPDAEIPSAPATIAPTQFNELLSMQSKMMQMMQSLTEREAKLQERINDFQDRERELMEREQELMRREAEYERSLIENGMQKDTECLPA